MANQIEAPTSGQPVNKLWKFVAQCVKALNAWANATVRPQNTGKFVLADGNVVLDLSPLIKRTALKVTDGTTSVQNVTTIAFVGALFTVSDGGNGIANV